jgi:hypothetical protein
MRYMLIAALALICACGSNPSNDVPDTGSAHEVDAGTESSSTEANDASVTVMHMDMPDAAPAITGPNCKSFNVGNAQAPEKTNAAWCFEAGDATNSCALDPSNNFTSCTTSTGWYEVDWYETPNGTEGNIFGGNPEDTTGKTVAHVVQASDGSFRFTNAQTQAEIGYCTVVGDIANVCVW